MSKRRRTRAALVAALDALEWGAPEAVTASTLARAPGWCPACGSEYDPGAFIQLLRYGPTHDRQLGWGHEVGRCPDRWQLLAELAERRDDVIVTRVVPSGRRTASCGHVVEGRPTYLVRRPVSLSEANHSHWLCEECVTR